MLADTKNGKTHYKRLPVVFLSKGNPDYPLTGQNYFHVVFLQEQLCMIVGILTGNLIMQHTSFAVLIFYGK